MSGTRLKNIWRKVRRVGPIYSLQLALDRALPGAFFTVNAYVIVERNPREGRPPDSDDPTIRWATANDVGLFANTGYRLEHVRERLQRGDRCVIREGDGKIVGYCWYAFNAYEQSDWLRVQLPPAGVWASDIWVAPEHRGRGNDARIKAFASKEFEAVGITKILSLVDALNRSSLRAHKKIGTRIHGRLFFVRVLGLMFVKVHGSARLGRWNSRNRYTLILEEMMTG